jgi:acyl carrier protein
MSTEADVREFVLDELKFTGSPDELTTDFPLLASGVLTSLGIMNLVAFLEARYAIEIDEEDLLPEHFATIRSVAALVASKQSA